MKKWAIIIIFAYIFTIIFGGIKLYISLTHPLKYKDYIIKYSKQNNLDEALVASIINAESSFKPNAKSPKNALGLMQIKLETAQYMVYYYKLDCDISEDALMQPETNIKIGCAYLNYLQQKFKDVNTCLAAYNAGETKVKNWLLNNNFSDDGISLKNIPYEETNNYIKKINKNIKYYKKYF